MAKEKKRGFFSWLGFGQKEQSATDKEQIEQSSQSSQQPTDDGHALRDTETLGAETPAVAPVAEPEVETPAIATVAEPEVETPVIAPVAEPEVETPVIAPIAEPEVETPAIAPVAEPEVETPVIAPVAEPEVETPVIAPVAEPEVETPVIAPIAEPEVETPAIAPVAEPEVETPAIVPATEPEVETPAIAPVAEPEVETPAIAPVAEPEVETPAIAPVAELEVETPVIAPVAEPEVETPAIAPVAEPEVETPAIAPVAEPEVETPAIAPVAESEVETPVPVPQEQEKPTKEGFFSRLKRSLIKTKQNLGSGFIGLFRGKKIDDDLFEELEEQLLIADVGVETTRKIIASLTETASRKQLRDAETLYTLLKEEMGQILSKVDQPLNVEGKMPFVILMVGVNGVGKTTTIGKLARQFESEGKSVMLAAGDTFRAAAVEQLQVWGQRNNIPVVAQHTGADSASVIFDAIQAAKARHVDVLIADTAGRLQNKAHLMEELKKIVRVMKKLDEDAPHEIMLTLDASTGQNAVSQAKLFHEAVGLSGITLTKLDGTAKGGVIFSIADQFGIPIRYIGVGEQLSDLRPFNANDFIEALFARED